LEVLDREHHVTAAGRRPINHSSIDFRTLPGEYIVTATANDTDTTVYTARAQFNFLLMTN